MIDSAKKLTTAKSGTRSGSNVNSNGGSQNRRSTAIESSKPKGKEDSKSLKALLRSAPHGMK